MKDSTRSKGHVVYRCYGADDRLVYVGMTSLTLGTRMCHHAIDNPAVVEQTARIETTPYPDRASAAEAESRAIDAEGPLLNIRRGAPYDSDWAELQAAIDSLPSAGGTR